MKPSEIVDTMYKEHLLNKVGPRSVPELKKAMTSAAKKNEKQPRKAAAKAAVAFLKEKGKKAPKSLLKLAGGGASTSTEESSKEKSSSNKAATKKPIKKSEKTKAEPEPKSDPKKEKLVKELQGKVLTTPAIATIKPAEMDKAALRTVLKNHSVEYDKADKESVLREKLITLLKRIALPVLNFSKADITKIAKDKDGEPTCYGVLIDSTAKECTQLCPVMVECRTTFKANIANPEWLQKALGEEKEEKPATKKKEKAAPKEDEEEESEEEEDEEGEEEEEKEETEEEDEEGEEEESEEAEEEEEDEEAEEEEAEEEGEEEEEEEEEEDEKPATKKKGKKASKSEDEEEEEEAEEDEEGEEEEAEEEEAEEEEEEEEDDKKTTKSSKASGRKRELVYDVDRKVKVFDVKNPMKKSDTAFDFMKQILAEYKGKSIKMGALLKIAEEHFEFENAKAARAGLLDFITKMEADDPQVLKVLGA